MIKTISTRSCNEILYQKSISLWLNSNKFQKFNNTNSVQYFFKLIEKSSGWVVNSDEDFFVANEELVDALILKMQSEGFVASGVPDRGIVKHRNFGEFVLNPFFNVFFVDSIKLKLKEYDEKIRYGHQLKNKKCYHGGLANIDYYEPFSNFFYWLECNFRVLPITDVQTTDGTDSVIMMGGEMLGVHSWYGRYYSKGCKLGHKNGCHPCRIDKCYELAKYSKKN